MDLPEKKVHPSLSGLPPSTLISSGGLPSIKGYLSATSSETSSPSGKTETVNPYLKGSVAKAYDEHYDTDIVYEIEESVISQFLEPYCDGARVLDLGAGTGLVAELTLPESYVAVDSSEEMLNVLTAKFAADKHVTPFTVVGDLCTAEGLQHVFEQIEPLSPFDCITCLWSGHFVHSRLLLRMLTNLLVPTGTLIMHGNFARRADRSRPAYLSKAQKNMWVNQIEGNVETSEFFTPKKLKFDLEAEGLEDVKIQGMNAVPDWLTRRLPEAWAYHLMRRSLKVRAKWHWHGAAIGRKPANDRF